MLLDASWPTLKVCTPLRSSIERNEKVFADAEPGTIA